MKSLKQRITKLLNELTSANEVVTKAQRGEFVLHERKATLINLKDF